ncbi:MAG: hypothetical protein NC818_07075 [Candidatus Omnitrophica bacterium]|nr:hypothetical protein [Candidatus Omnitrophota bacterium]
MSEIKLIPREGDAEVFSLLEKRGLIRLLRPPKMKNRRQKTGCFIDKIYTTSPRFGTHKLICVTLNTQEVKLNSHPDNEEFILINPDHYVFKPLYLILALHKNKILEKKIKDKKLSSKDFIVLRLKYNCPQTSIFTLLKDTVHCEVTLDGEGRPPIFFVAEPSRLTACYLNLDGYKLILENFPKGGEKSVGRKNNA